MILNVKLIKSPSMFCEESCAATVAKWLNRDYQMMFCVMMGFSYKGSKKYKKLDIGRRVSCRYKKNDFVKNLKYYHGIEVKTVKVTGNINKYIIQEINSNEPILIFPLMKYCNWLNDKKDSEIYFLVIGYDDNLIYGYDVHSNSGEIHTLPIADLVNSYRESEKKEVRVYRIISKESKRLTFKEIRKYLIVNKYLCHNTWIQMNDMARDIRDTSNVIFEHCKEGDPNKLPIFFEIMHILRARKLFAETCYYIAEKNKNSYARFVGACYLEIGGEWNILWNLLLKMYYSKNMNSSYREKISRKIEQIADLEKNIIFNILYEGKEFEKGINKSNTIEADDKYIFINLDISKLYNNKAFHYDNDKNAADMTGKKEYFEGEKSLKNREVFVGKTSFVIPSEFDNFICMNQCLDIIDIGISKKIYILGCAEWGNGYGKILVGYEDSVESLILEFPDWYFSRTESTYVAWRGEAIDSGGNKVERALFCLDYELPKEKEIKWIKFPDADNIHIFGVKLLIHEKAVLN